jgi:gliding motility-associated-like protein
MRKIFITILTSIFIFLNNADAQLTVSMSSVTVEQNTQASVDVTVNGFTNLLGVQFSINYDSLILGFNQITNFSGALPGLSASSVSGPNGVGVKNGQIIFTWNDPQGVGKSLPNGSRLFTLEFNATGPKGSKSDVAMSNVPRIIDVVNGNLGQVDVVNVKGTVTINGNGPVDPCPNPTCTNATNLTFTGEVLNGEKDKTICVPITVKNFKIMQSGQGSVSWDPAILQFIEVKTPTTGGIPGFSGGFNTANVSTGKFIFLWSNETPAIPLTLPDNTVIMEFCFKAIGNVGQTGCVLFGTGTLETEWENDNGSIPICISYGKVTITDNPPPDAVTIKVGTINGKIDDTVCVDVTVDNFKNVLSMQTKFSWDASQLEFIRTDMYNLESLNSSAFSNMSNMLNFSWNSQDLVTKPNGHKIFQICFKIKQCLPSMAITVPGPTEVGGAGAVEIPSQTVGGSVTCTTPNPMCSATCVLGAVTNVSCNGRTDGSVALAVTGTNLATHMVVWKRNGVVVKASAPVTSGTNLTGVGAGTYTYEVTFNGEVCCTGNATVGEPTVITIPTVNVVTNVGCGQKGAINISATSGGNGGFGYAWTPNLGNTANPTNLDQGAYSVVVTDSKGCTASASFTVGNTQPELIVTSSSTNVKCKGGSDGSIQINVTGGCPNYTYTWTGGLSGSNPQNVKAGTYTVTVTDISVPGQSKTVTVTIEEPANGVSIALTGTVDASTASASDGKISLNITGGKPDYSTVWSGPTSIPDGTTSGPIDANNVKPGSYNVTVTDANGCTAIRSGIVVGINTPIDTTKAPKIASAAVSSNFNGFGVPCFGDDDGSVTATLSEGAFPITVNLKSGTQTFRTITINSNNISFTGLVAGTYTIEVTNAKGTVTSGPLVITQPTKLAATVKQNCSEANKETGNIELNMNNTGAGNYSYNWFGSSDIDNKLENLAKGFYNVTVTDANNCEVRLTNIEINECEFPGECYIGSTIITPNGDNFNDIFKINCVQQNSSDLSVFDRWGRLIYSQSNYDNTWQGIDNDGKDLKEGAYIWVLTVNFGQGRREVYKGTVTVIRAN